MLYELFGGKRAFEGDSFASTLYKILQESPTSLRELDPTLPVELVQIVERALAKDPADRFPDGGAFAEAIRRVASGGTLTPVVGPGTSAGAVMQAAGQAPTLLGIDALRGGRVVAREARAADILELAGDGPVRIVLGVTGRQGLLLGRGNKGIAAALVARAGREGLVVLASPDKLAGLAEPRLWIDTGDPLLDRALEGFVRVRTGAGRDTVMRLSAG